ncbi:hypothetical protein METBISCDRAFT_18785 [Metschnikowia bicuspidata]|uniref:Uncharacterized protein n=1 Tax=Metschnikowia bicuspidata TaxID=27322 RepID=A0A4P9ZBF2_9ASCO|nr:hypothetical protein METBISCDRAFT_18785 [Metschnikowia bicuspidata]
MRSLFTYPISQTPWLIVITENAGHYYFNKESRVSVWQISETGIKDFASRVDFNELAILFGKANGFGFPEETNRDRKRRKHQGNQFREIEAPVDDKAPSESNTESELQEIINNVDEQTRSGIDLGYSSSDESEDQREKNTDSNGDNNEDVTSDVNAGLDLGLESDDYTNTGDFEKEHHNQEQFLLLLDEFSTEISVYDPWFVVQEEFMPKFVHRPEYFGVDEELREELYNKWKSECGQEAFFVSNTKDGDLPKYPTPRLLFYQFLQNYKSDVKKYYYSEFQKAHGSELQNFLSGTAFANPEETYRKLRVKLNDFTEFEKTTKANMRKKPQADNGPTNLKVSHVQDFLVKAEGVQDKGPLFVDTTKTPFDQWMQICNHFDLPAQVVHHPTNFVLGDEKRLQCYKERFIE